MDVSATLLAATASAALRDRFRRDRAPSSAARARRRPRDARADLAVFDHYSAADPLPHGLELGQAAFVVLVAVRATAAATVAFELRDVHG
jgi:hypothetical protein